MAVSKRTRYEVLRRDNHTCRYCGGAAPDVKLTVDHVLPVALGGTDDPSNLVAACQDCNAGKSSSAPDAPMIEDVKQADLRWADALKRAASAREQQREKADAYVRHFDHLWLGWRYGYEEKAIPRPSNWQHSIERFYQLGVPTEEIERLIPVACGNNKVPIDETFRYFAGCVWRYLSEIQDAARALLDAEEAESGA